MAKEEIMFTTFAGAIALSFRSLIFLLVTLRATMMVMENAKEYFSYLRRYWRSFLVSLGVLLASYVVLYFILLSFFAFPLISLEKTIETSLGTMQFRETFLTQFGGDDVSSYATYLFEALKTPTTLFSFYPALKREIALSYPDHDPSLDILIDNTQYTLYLSYVIGGIFLFLTLFFLFTALIRHFQKKEIYDTDEDLSRTVLTSLLLNLSVIGILIAVFFSVPHFWYWFVLPFFFFQPFSFLFLSFQGYGKGRIRLSQAVSFPNFLFLSLAILLVELLIALLGFLFYLWSESIVYAFLSALLFSLYPLALLYVFSNTMIRKEVMRNLTEAIEKTGRKKNTLLVKNKTTKHKIAFLCRHLGFRKEECLEIRKMYDGDFFNPSDEGVKRLYRLSEEYCRRYNTIYERLYLEKGIPLWKDELTLLRLTKILFCGTYMMADVRSSLSLVIGLVDAPWLTFFNHGVTFSPYTSVSFGSSVDVAPQVFFGDKEPERKGNLIRVSHINVEADCWIGIHAWIYGEVTLARGSVIGAGARVEQDVLPYSLALGRPAKLRREIPYNGKEKKKKEPRIFTRAEEKILYQGLKKVSPLSHHAYRQVLKGKFFNVVSFSRMALYNRTHHLCAALDNPSLSAEEREKLLDLLFPGHGKNLKVGKRLFVDMVGMVLIEDNVTLGDDVALGGNVRIGNDVRIGNRVSLFSSGHPLSPKERNMRFSLRHGFYQVSRHEPIRIEDHAVLGDDVVVGPNSIVKGVVSEDSLYLRNRILKETTQGEEELRKTILTQGVPLL